jgi:hypothetical protein
MNGNSLADAFMTEEDLKDPLWHLNKLFSTASGIGSLPDVLYNTDRKDPLSMLSVGPRYLLNILKGAAGQMLPIDAPEFKTFSDLMQKENFSTGNKNIDFGVGMAGDMMLDPLMYLGGAGTIGKIGNAAKYSSILGGLGAGASGLSDYFTNGSW